MQSETQSVSKYNQMLQQYNKYENTMEFTS